MLIYQDNFLRAFGRDADYHDIHPQNTWLDRRTGYILWVCEKDEDASDTLGISPDENRKLREHVSAEPDRYLEIPGLGHGEHHEILQKFLQSEWTDNMELRESVEGKYFKSIGAWKGAVSRWVVSAFEDFRYDEILNMAKKWLMHNGIDPTWK